LPTAFALATINKINTGNSFFILNQFLLSKLRNKYITVLPIFLLFRGGFSNSMQKGAAKINLLPPFIFRGDPSYLKIT
jgi:hypothetical protein